MANFGDKNSGKGGYEGSNNSGGLFGTILGMFGFRQHNICKSDDDTFYCKFMRIFQLFIAIIIAIIIVITILYILKFLLSSKGKLFGGRIRK